MERICPNCGKKHDGEGLSPSVANRKICGKCYKAKEIARTQAYRAVPANQTNLPDYAKEFDDNMRMYIRGKIRDDSKLFNMDQIYIDLYQDFILETALEFRDDRTDVR